MSTLDILLWPDRRLSQKCSVVDAFDENLQTLAHDMLDTMYAATGRGLAAPQIGQMMRMFVMDAGWKSGAPTPLICVNPKFQEIGPDTRVGMEQCLSIPDQPINVRRFSEIDLHWTDLENRAQSCRMTGDAAVIAQHEIDHLDGRVILDIKEPAA